MQIYVKEKENIQPISYKKMFIILKPYLLRIGLSFNKCLQEHYGEWEAKIRDSRNINKIFDMI